MRRALVLALALAATGCGSPDNGAAVVPAQESAKTIGVPAGVYRLDTTHASLFWSVRHLGLSDYTARFTGLDATLQLDPDDIARSSITLTIDPKSVRADYPADYRKTHAKSAFSSWDEDLAMSKSFLNAGAFPNIAFKSTTARQTGPDTAEVVGDLTFLGVTRPVTMNVKLNGELATHPFSRTPAIGFAAEGRFKRSDFGMSTSGVIGDEVSLRFNGEFLMEPPPAATAEP